jgi:hypothetical protein
MPIQPTASKTTVLLNCSYPFSKRVEIPHEEEVDEAPRYGSAFHRLLELAPLGVGERFGDDYDALVEKTGKKWGLTPGVRQELAEHVRGALPVLQKWLSGRNQFEKKFNVKKLRREVSFAAEPMGDNVREIDNPREADHVYEDLEEGEVAMTADLWDLGFVLDHKTGSVDDNFSKPTKNNQLKTLALTTRSKTPIVAIFHADRRGLPIVYADEIEEGALDKHELKLRRAIRRIGDGSMRPSEPGKGEQWCQYCPARSVCPTQTANLLTGAAAVVTDAAVALARLPKGGLVTDEQVGNMHYFFSEIDRLKEAAKPLMRAHVKRALEEGHEVSRKDGKVLVIRTRTEERLSKTKIIEALGKPEAERLFKRLRKAGALVETESEGLWAVFPE